MEYMHLGALNLRQVSLRFLWHNQAKNLCRERVEMIQGELAPSNIPQRSRKIKIKR